MTKELSEEEKRSLIEKLIVGSGGEPESFEADLIIQQLLTSLKMLNEGHHTGQLKVITRSLKEMRYGYRVFNQYPGVRRFSVFGSARTPEDHEDFKTAEELGRRLNAEGWMCITGAADGIMKAGMAGISPEHAFGLSIQLPFESRANTIIEGDPKLINFRYFFTRKLMFMSHSDAFVVFPGGYGTLDELFEVLTLIQTGRGEIKPIVLMEEEKGIYWKEWEKYVTTNLINPGRTSAADKHLYYIAPSVDAALSHILRFYHRYHSSRYVRDWLVIRLNHPITKEHLNQLNKRFSSLCSKGEIVEVSPFEEERDNLELTRIAFHHTKADFAELRQLIDAINEE